MLLSGCATKAPRLGCYCPSIETYPKAFNSQLANELGNLKDGMATVRAMADYIALRDEIRAACGVK